MEDEIGGNVRNLTDAVILVADFVLLVLIAGQM